jgi:hypothetical protein
VPSWLFWDSFAFPELKRKKATRKLERGGKRLLEITKKMKYDI